MLYIGICDDEKEHREAIKLLCETYFAEYPIEHGFFMFSSGEEILSFNESRLHLLFLDIEMGGISGIDVMDALKNNDNVWRIVFVTSHAEMFSDTIGLKTLAFVQKPITKRVVFRCLETAILENEGNISISFKGLKGSEYFLLDDIIYAVAEGHYVRLRTNSKQVFICENMTDCLKKLTNTTIIRVHRSYAANLAHVKSWEKDVITFFNEEMIPVGRIFSKPGRERWFEYLKQTAKRRQQINSRL